MIAKEEIIQVDKINSLLDKITIPAYKNKKLGTIEYVKFLNSEIEKTEYRGGFSARDKYTSDYY